MERENKKYKYLGAITLSLCAVYAVIAILGEITAGWSFNLVCNKFFGCTEGFFGYDAFEHFLSAMTAVLVIVWFCNKFPKYSILQDGTFKSMLFIISFIMFLCVAWEILECAHDAFRLSILHEPLRNIRLHINYLDQPTNIDTMGDLTFSLFGAVVGIVLMKFPKKTTKTV